jgi:hypothetical protein
MMNRKKWSQNNNPIGHSCLTFLHTCLAFLPRSPLGLLGPPAGHLGWCASGRRQSGPVEAGRLGLWAFSSFPFLLFFPFYFLYFVNI